MNIRGSWGCYRFSQAFRNENVIFRFIVYFPTEYENGLDSGLYKINSDCYRHPKPFPLNKENKLDLSIRKDNQKNGRNP